MISSSRVTMTLQHYTLLQKELAELRSCNRAETSAGAVGYDRDRIARRSVRQLRIREIEDLLIDAVVDGEPVSDPVAEGGMVLTIRYDATGELETFLLGRRHAEGVDGVKVYSTLSPLGGAIVGARLGEQRIYPIPHEAGRPVTLLEAVPYEMYASKC